MQAMFDGVEDGGEYDEYTGKTGWTAEKYRARLTAFAKAALSLDSDANKKAAPAAIALVEVENAGVVRDFARDYLKKEGYKYTFFTGNPGFSLGVGLISKYPIVKSATHSIINNETLLPRPIAEVWIDVEGENIVIFVCHWKSKLGDPEVTEAQRRDATRILNRRIAAIGETHPQIGIIVSGDLNENYDEFFRTGETFLTALMPDTQEALDIATAHSEKNNLTDTANPRVDNPQVDNLEFLLLSTQKPPQSEFFPGRKVVLYTPWENEMGIGSGSYYYQKNWETIDHFLLSASLFDEAGWEFKGAYVCDIEPFVNAAGTPATYNPRTGNGISDHLPIVLKLTKKP
jgi:endonuclease/exonuclease/phosphatase family metal-dependent hydrolase